MDIFSVFIPFVNIVTIPIAISATNRYLPGKRSVTEMFFGIKKDDYWRKGDAE
ncbi:hypothetical protein [Sporosarcina sp. ITBMC105]